MPTNNSINSQDPIQVSKGGTGQSTLTTANGILAAGTSATGAIQNIGTGSAGQVLTSNGTSLPSFQAAPSGGAMVLLHTITFNGTFSSVDLTPFVSGYDIYQFISTPVPNLNVNNIILEFSVTGGASWITSGYFTDLASFDGGSISGNQAFTAGIPIVNYGGGGAPTNYSGVNNTTMTGYGSAQGPYVWGLSMTTFGGRCIPQICAGFLPNTVVNGIRIVEATPGNWTAGKFSIYGITT